jgi:protein-L-isoaspartate(D-aspartate) O-methyltransferase
MLPRRWLQPGCSPAPRAGSPGSPPGGSPTAPATIAGGELDRVLADSDAERARRDELVDTSVVPFVSDARVIDAIRAVPRHSFVPTDQLDQAYADHPLPIGYGQTISQPSLVAMMTELLDVQPGERVLEIGTGSGYQAAILRELTDQVYSVEIIPELAASAGAVLVALGYGDVHVDRRDGYFGWPEHGPYDAIVVTAAPDHLPSPLLDQLAPGGRIVIPIGPPGDVQTLWLVTRDAGEVRLEQLMSVQFVPLTRAAP